MRVAITRVLLAVLLVLLAVAVLQPLVDRWLVMQSAPRPVDARGSLSEFETTSVRLFETISPSVVQVGVPHGRFTQEMESGTGFVWDDAGHIVTNNHVIENGTAIFVRLVSGQVFKADLVGRAPNYDLAVIRLGPGASHPPPIPLGSSRDLKVGQAAFVIGNPFGLDQSLTSGVISALERRLPTSGDREISSAIQTDAAINPGNSGGPLLDSAGRLIGVTTAIYSPSGANAGIGFAIPVDVVNRVVPTLIRTGRYPTPGIGIAAADERMAAQLGINGVIVAQVMPGSPADKAGLIGLNLASGTIGDVIVAVDGKPVQHLANLVSGLEEAGVGAQVELTVARDARQRTVPVQVVDIGG
ncbi:trypsin-like peptidase domain-containing protein [Pseudaminobacter sp. 19-2017]|uniref:Trypsin-like peptidase domain-containing protein n=1 Tax=Pseudaminobacter soli (ex Zhang et al. 2022) TaxID=2831468 RepID=A0A942E6A3_9HYPH|nr:trypsin-like peptidase domain-containing protein [Pseudaminobacter soli]MBS3651731.1 trypsin-like peptidase domain-containing protein [Pseudaminobacter soli]